MAKKSPQQQFEVTERTQDAQQIIIRGRKLRPPAKRIVLVGDGLKLVQAKIVRLDKAGSTDLTLKRINHLTEMNEIRLHTEEVIFPGEYEVRLVPKQ